MGSVSKEQQLPKEQKKTTRPKIVQYTLYCIKIKNGNGECVKETTIRQKSRKHHKATNGSSTQRENPAPGGITHIKKRFSLRDNRPVPIDSYATITIDCKVTLLRYRDGYG